MHRPALLALVAVAALLAACDDTKPEFSDTPLAARATDDEPDVMAIRTTGGEVQLGLTDSLVYFRFSDSLLAKVDTEMASGVDTLSGVGGSIARMVTGKVSDAMRHRAQYRVADIRDVREENGRLVFEFERGGQMPDLEVDNRPIVEQFAPADVERFAAAFRRVKAAASRLE